MTDGTPLLQLKTGDTALVHVEQLAKATADKLTCLEGLLVTTTSARVFTARHDTENIVVEVSKYASEHRPKDLIRLASAWKREVHFLERLRHSFDGRLLALYVEHLPPSLERARKVPFTSSDAHAILHNISPALGYLKQEGVFHNDIKPSNITYSSQRGAVLIDFGIATTKDEDPSYGGTPWYMPPKFLNPRKSRNHCGDVWALGVTMLYVLGKTPLPGRGERPWLICEANRVDSSANLRMVDWLRRLAAIREQLHVKKSLEQLVY